MEEMIVANLQKDIADATEAMAAMLAADMPVKSACGWGKNNDPSSLLTRVRRAPGRNVSLAVLHHEAPAELKQYTKDGATFAMWLRHRTGLLKVNGLPGEEFVVFAGSAKEQAAEHEAALDPQAEEFNPLYGLDLCEMAEYMAYDEACNDLAAFMSYFEEGQSGTEYVLPDDFAESGVAGLDSLDDLLNSEVLELQAIGPPPGLTLEVDPGHEAEQVVKAGGLNPKAAEFRPTKALAHSDKVIRSRRVKTGVPDMIPEEPITGSSETASGGEDPAIAYEESISGEDEDEVATAKAAAVERHAVAQSSMT
ncbi:unnamed protein product [Symbiodinium natans]|uniref:Uncharacterized protein n=1 Tax=Symbiodinium natans TaxID=878477 RepID=A0A812RDF0_9DINO|nr:unnamed protein product [Symbiodinium natans]